MPRAPFSRAQGWVSLHISIPAALPFGVAGTTPSLSSCTLLCLQIAQVVNFRGNSLLMSLSRTHCGHASNQSDVQPLCHLCLLAPITHPMPTITDSTCNPSNPMPAARCTIRLTVTKGHLCCFVLCALAQSDVQHFDTFGKRPLALAALPSPPFFFIFLSMSNQTLPPILIQKVSDKRSAIMPPHDNCRGSQKGLGLLTE